MSKNLVQVNATLSLPSLSPTDLMYVVTGGTTDAGITGANVIAMFAPTIGSTSITTLGTITTGTWNGSIIAPAFGGTGVNNGTSTFTIGGSVAFIGAFTFDATLTGNTAVTFPTTGTLATTSQLLVSPLTTKGDIWVWTTTNDRLPVAVGDGKILQVSAAAASGLAYSTPTYPSTSATLNHFIISDGTNFVPSTFSLNLAGNLTTSGAFSSTFTMTNTTNVTFPTTGTLATTSQLVQVNNVVSTPILLVNNNGYVVNNGVTLVTFQLPTTATIGHRFAIIGHSAGGWIVTQTTASQHIHFGTATSTTGLAGSVSSTNGNDCIEFVCTATDTEFTIRNAVGNITVT